MNTAELATLYNIGARVNFAADGSIRPMLAFHGGPTELLVPCTAKWHPADTYCAVAWAMGCAIPATHLVTVTEAWGAEVHVPTVADLPPEVQRGWLQEQHEKGAMQVDTVLMVQVIDTADLAASELWINRVDHDTAPRRDTFEMEGSMVQRIFDAYREGQAKGMPAGSGWNWHHVAELLIVGGAAETVIEYHPDKPHRWN